ncbi:MAG: nucleotidyl transferase AbiEii/AbiGii toxin family protein [Phycisphaerales bacterium]|nr:nucleotidyl transferase AbiEii/AbiGii toxin family protein [Phycisphaerales bacterium]
MTKRAPSNVAASVHSRLLNQARETAKPFNDLLQHYALERFLFRLSHSDFSSKFILKGALLLRVWEVSSIRPTRDIDLLGKTHNDLERVRSIIQQLCVATVNDDGMSFDAESIRAAFIAEDAEYEGIRIEFTGRLGNARIPMQIDIGFGDRVTPAPTIIEYPTVLASGPIRLLAYTPETTIAEKFQVMLSRGLLNSRMKDYFDIWALAKARQYDGQLLAEAIATTCTQRKTAVSQTPSALSKAMGDDEQRRIQWTAFRRRLQPTDAPESLDELVAAVARFLSPVANALATHAPFKHQWTPGGPWA